jgi:hypothetical protein
VSQENLENLVQVVFQYFRTLNSLTDLQESTRLHLVESDLATHLLGLLNDYEQANPLDSDPEDEREPDSPDNVLPTVDVKAVELLAVTQLVEFCYADPEIYLDPAGYYRFVPELGSSSSLAYSRCALVAIVTVATRGAVPALDFRVLATTVSLD